MGLSRRVEICDAPPNLGISKPERFSPCLPLLPSPARLSRWNQLDLAIVLLSIMGITLEEIEMSAALPINPTIIRIMRVLRIARGRRPAGPSQYPEAGGCGGWPCCRAPRPQPVSFLCSPCSLCLGTVWRRGV